MMFSYANSLIAKKAGPSVENGMIALLDPIDTGSDAQKELSSGASQLIACGALRGLIWAFAYRMVLRGVAKEEIATGIGELINAARRAGDIDKRTASYLGTCDWYDRIDMWGSCGEPCLGSDSSLWSLVHDALQSAKGAREWASEWAHDIRKSTNEQEQAILDNFNKAQQAYFEALRVRDDYFSKKADKTLKAIVAKYASIFEKLDSDLYKYISGTSTGVSDEDPQEADVPTAPATVAS